MEAPMQEEASVAVMREALEATLQSHMNQGRARPCECSLCVQIRHALQPDGGKGFADRIREECAQIADWKAKQAEPPPGLDNSNAELAVKAVQRAAKEIADRIRVLKGRRF
jgi:hypothetical protein